MQSNHYFCNIPFGLPDRFLRFLYIHKEGNEGQEIQRLTIRLWKEKSQTYRQDTISELIQLLENRYFLSERIYFHHAKIISSAMISAAVWDAIQSHKLNLDNLYLMGDDELLRLLTKDNDNSIAYKLASRLIDRKLYKRFKYRLKDKDVVDEREDRLNKLKNKYHLNAKERAETEAKLCNFINVDPGDILIYCPDPEMNLKSAEMFVTWRGAVKKFKEIDDKLIQDKVKSILDSHKKLWSLQVFVKPEINEDQKKCELLYKWCEAMFEDESAVKGAIESTIRDILNEKDINHTIKDADNILASLVACSGGVPIDKIKRSDIEEEVSRHFVKSENK